MKVEILDINDYLEIIEQGLNDFPDKNIIIQELRNYIFDLANDIAQTSGKHNEECFKLALEKLEKPEIMIALFKQENANLKPEKQINYIEHIKTPLFHMKRNNLKQLCVFSLLTSVFIYFMIRTSNFSSFQSEIILINVLRVLLILGFITGLTYLYNDQIIKHQRQRLRQLFTKDIELINIKLGKKSLQFIKSRKFQTMKLILSSLFTLTILVLIIINNSNELSNRYQFLIEEYSNYALIALVIICFGMMVSNTIPFLIKPNNFLKIVQICTTIITLAGMTFIMYYYPFNFEYMNMIIDHNMQTLFILIIGYLFMKIVNLMEQLSSTIIRRRKFNQEKGVISNE